MNTARQIDAGVRPHIVHGYMTVKQAINGRNQDCTHYADCISVASLDPNAKGFICTGCPDYEPQGTAIRAKDSPARPPAQETMLFDMQPPFELRLVRVDEIDIDYEIARKAVSKLSSSIEALGILADRAPSEDGEGDPQGRWGKEARAFREEPGQVRAGHGL